jgi:hypothetical protein
MNVELSVISYFDLETNHTPNNLMCIETPGPDKYRYCMQMAMEYWYINMGI